MAGTLLVSNVHFESTGTKRIDYLDDDILRISVGETILSGSGSIKIPVGTTEQRPTGEAGMVRYNSTTDEFEGYNASSWGTIGGGGGPTILPVLTRLGSTVNITVGNGLIAILTRTGATVNVAVN